MATILNHLGIIQRVFDQYPEDAKALVARCDATDKRREQFGPDDPEVQAGVEWVDNMKGKFTRRFAIALKGVMPEVGLRRKDVGAHATRADGVRHATDALMMRSDGKIIDVMKDRGPVWVNRDGDFQPVDQWLEPLPEDGIPTQPPQPPPTEPPSTSPPLVDFGPIYWRLEVLDAGRLADRAELDKQITELRDLLTALRAREGFVKGPSAYEGRSFLAHNHSVDLPVQWKERE